MSKFASLKNMVLAALVAVGLLAGCGKKEDVSTSAGPAQSRSAITIECIQGIQYFTAPIGNSFRPVTPVIDATTRMPTLC